MIWNVYRLDFNSREIKTYNIFSHYFFTEAVKKLKNKKLSRGEFADKLKSELMYYFWSKYEHEATVTSFPPYIDKKELDRLNSEYEEYNHKYGHYPYKMDVRPEVSIKIDIYNQVMLNWEVFVEYVWRAK